MFSKSPKLPKTTVDKCHLVQKFLLYGTRSFITVVIKIPPLGWKNNMTLYLVQIDFDTEYRYVCFKTVFDDRF